MCACSTVGQLNDAALFYMQQRGVSREEAKLLLQIAFINEVIFTRGTTESLNLVVSSFCDAFMSEGDEVIISTMNITPISCLGSCRLPRRESPSE